MNFNINLVKHKLGQITLNTKKITVKIQERFNPKENIEIKEIYCSNEEAEDLINNIIPKHKLWTFVSEEDIDTTDYKWMEQLSINSTNNFQKEIQEIASYGSLEAYQASQQSSIDDYLLTLEERISTLELTGGETE